jgi:hypothetical protein
MSFARLYSLEIAPLCRGSLLSSLGCVYECRNCLPKSSHQVGSSFCCMDYHSQHHTFFMHEMHLCACCRNLTIGLTVTNVEKISHLQQ